MFSDRHKSTAKSESKIAAHKNSAGFLCASYKDLCLAISKRKNYATRANVHLFSLTLQQRDNQRMIEQNPSQRLDSHLRDIAFKGLIYAETPQSRLRSGDSTTRSLKNLINNKAPMNTVRGELEKKLSYSDESLETLSISAAVAELRPQPEILPFSVDLPVKCKMLPLVKQNSAPASTTVLSPRLAPEVKKNANEKTDCKCNDYNDYLMTTKLFEADCNTNADLISDFFMTDHYLMLENKYAQKKPSSEVIAHTQKNLIFTEWNDGISDWYPNNPYPPLKYYIRSMIKHRTKQGNNYEFDAGLGFHLPTNRFGMRNQTMTQTTGTSAVAASKPEAASTAHKNPLNSQAVYGMNKFTDPVAQHYTDYRNQAETLLYSNATRMLQLRSEELDRVREIDTYTTSNLNEFQMASYTPPPLPPPPPPPHKQEHLTDTRISKAMRSYAHGEVERARTRSKTADEIEAERIKSYNEGASIFKIHKIREFTPDFDRQGGSSGSGKPELAGQRSSMEIIAADKVKQKHESVNAGYYVNHSNELSIEPTVRTDIALVNDNGEIDPKKNNTNQAYVNFQLARISQTNFQNLLQSQKKQPPLAASSGNTNNSSSNNKKKPATKATEISRITTFNNSTNNYNFTSQPNSNTSLSVYNPFLIASQPMSLGSKFTDPHIYTQINSAPPYIEKGKQFQQQQDMSASAIAKNSEQQQLQQQANLSALNSANENSFTSLPPIISGKRIKLPLGPHRRQLNIYKISK